MICASVPTLRPLAKKHFPSWAPKVLGQSDASLPIEVQPPEQFEIPEIKVASPAQNGDQENALESVVVQFPQKAFQASPGRLS